MLSMFKAVLWPAVVRRTRNARLQRGIPRWGKSQDKCLEQILEHHRAPESLHSLREVPMVRRLLPCRILAFCKATQSLWIPFCTGQSRKTFVMQGRGALPARGKEAHAAGSVLPACCWRGTGEAGLGRGRHGRGGDGSRGDMRQGSGKDGKQVRQGEIGLHRERAVLRQG